MPNLLIAIRRLQLVTMKMVMFFEWTCFPFQLCRAYFEGHILSILILLVPFNYNLKRFFVPMTFEVNKFKR